MEFPVIFTAKFTLFKEEHAQILDELLPKKKEFNRADGEFDERTQAKLAFELSTKRLVDSVDSRYKPVLAEIRNSSAFVEHSRLLLEKTPPESFSLEKKPAPAVVTRTIPKPFHYFGNSTNYMENIIKILEVSDGFAKAGTVRDITCGSCILTFYLASQYPDKKYIASDINGEIINALNYIKQTDLAVIRNKYIEELASKAKKRAQKSLVELAKQKTNKEIERAIVFEALAQKIADEILASYEFSIRDAPGNANSHFRDGAAGYA